MATRLVRCGVGGSTTGYTGNVGLVRPTTGVNTPLVTAMAGPHGEAFIPTHN